MQSRSWNPLAGGLSFSSGRRHPGHEMVVICKKCGKKTPEGKLCQICGAFLAPPVQCPGCGRSTAAGVTKCAYCGAAIVPVKPPDLVTCPKCGRKMAAHLVACV